FDAGAARRMWVTNGTSPGTIELSTTAPPTGGPVTLGNTVIYQSEGSLAITDGTPAHTFTILSHAAGTAAFLFPNDFTVFNGKVYFAGVDQIFLGSSAIGLWATDGTTAGTVEVIPSGPENTGSTGRIGLNPRELTVFGSKLAFVGRIDIQDPDQIWVFDGSSSTPLRFPLNAEELAGLGNKLMFADFHNLGASDGTNGGTSFLNIAGAGPNGIRATDLTTVGNKVFFNGQDAASLFGLWTSDGTAGGTVELNVAGTYANGLNPHNLTAFGDKALFQG